MPKWLAPWLLPIALLVAVGIGVLAGSIGTSGSTVLWVLFWLVLAGGPIRLRLQYLKKNPPDPELTHKPFWRF